MDFKQLRYFVTIVECGSFTKAAERVHVAQPALSQHVRQMEALLSVKLLHRGHSGVIPTEAGDRLYAHAKAILDEFAKIPDSVRTCVAPTGEVRLGLCATVAELVADPLTEAARIRYPGIRIRIVQAMSNFIIESLAHGEVDLAICYGAAKSKRTAVHHILSDPICLFAVPDRDVDDDLAGAAISFSRAAQLPLVVPGPGHLRELIQNAATSTGVTILPSVETDSMSQIKKLVAQRIGYGILPRAAISREVAQHTFRMWTFCEPEVIRKICLSYSLERPLTDALRAIAQLGWNIARKLVRDRIWAAELASDINRPELYPYSEAGDFTSRHVIAS